ncbi:type I restriction endonuclease [Thiobacillus sp. 0-1251]|uniref:type I restriction endonuclease subunit R n=1 Tax=Thiobacillus sp. 0-1251 TaxID=1895858 RepID=UPI000963B0FD|nr:type I restriction endonuclease [Thiobacillus sp. 0-1251]OJY56388.1 MAG: restriction endonuclease subunit R [Thiobacillus sp. 0-1251]
MTALHTEIHFEQEICGHLAAHGWLCSPDDSGYDRELALFPEDVIAWLSETQPNEWAKVKAVHNDSSEKMLLKRLAELMDKDGSLSLLRHGFKNVNARFDMCQFKPAQKMNPETLARYGKVRVRVMRQVHYCLSNQNSIDLVVFVNGIPVATLELKTDFTQSVKDAIHQYRHDRPVKDPVTKREEPLLAFKRRSLVHFAVSTDEVWMTTKLDGKETRFLPFNLGNDGGKGNPPNPDGYRTSYLWEHVLDRDAWLDILGRFVHLEKKQETLPDGSVQEKQALIFPRFHQWEAVTQLVATARAEGPGMKYLVQHSAGSGKTNSISWLSHQLASLHDEADTKLFDSVIVITDRTVLDSQLQDAIYQFEHKHGVVVRITDEGGSKSSQLVKALADRAPIIIVTIQTFPFVLDAIRDTVTLKGRRFAVIADEAHTSQTGSAAKKLKQVLTAERLAEIEDGAEVDLEEILEAEMAGQVQPNTVSYFAFTATPKAKTLELFGRPGPDGLPAPFHVYSMQQAIEEGFILDVLKNYTPYKLAFKLAHDGQDYDDEQVDQNRALKSLMNWVRLHPHNIAQKVQVIVEHFRANVMWRLNGRAKAMVVTSSRKEAVRYKLAMDKYIKAQGYRDVSTLVAFSGDVNDPESGPSPFNESNMNPGLNGRDMREAFATDEYQVMLVANKFQTGFDQPLLVAMYVDKKLAGVSAVQTLSRLNRTYPGKTDTFVLDFVNDPGEILTAFRTYFRAAQLSGVSDPNLIHDLQAKLDATGIYLPEEVEGFAEAYYRKGTQKDLQARIGPAVERFRVRYTEAEQQKDKKAIEALDLFRKDLGGFVRAYDFLSQIVDYGDSDLFKRSLFYKHLAPLIAEEVRHEAIDLSSVLMTHYNLRDLGKRKLGLAEPTEEPTTLDPMTGIGSRLPQDPRQALLSEIVGKMNDLFEGEELTDADRINYVNHIAGKMMESEILAQQAAANQKAQFGDSPDFMNAFEDAVMAAYENHKSMSEQVMGKGHVKKAMAAMLLDLVYDAFQENR